MHCYGTEYYTLFFIYLTNYIILHVISRVCIVLK